MVDAVAREFGARESGIVEQEIDSFVEGYAPSAPLEPAFEEFLGKLVKKIGRGVRKVAGTALKVAKTLGLAPILNRIKALIRPLLNKVMQKAIGKLPEAVRPAAQMLAQRLGLATPPPPAAPAADAATLAAAPAAADAAADPALAAATAAAAAQTSDAPGSPVQPSAGAEVTEMQLEFDEAMAEALLADNELQLELETARERSAPGAARPVFADLEDARERFANDLLNLKDGENPAPYVENFVPAILPALKIGIRLIGRPKVIGFLAGILGKLISKLVGPAQTPALSRAIVDAGLKLISLEHSQEDEAGVATSAVAATVEETITRIASLPEHVLEDQQLLEGFALEAFEQAAAANLPAVFSEATYKKRPELLEGGVNAAWVMRPRRRPRYKRCSKTFNVKLTPHMAEEIESFEDARLSEYLQDQLGLEEGEDVEAEVHLFEVLPGSTLGDIAALETETPGLGASDEATVAQLHPLTNEAAGVLLGKPGLGRPLPAWSNIRNVAAGQRVYHLAIGRRPLTVVGRGKRARLRRLARLHVTLDGTNDRMRVCLFLSEVKAQRLAVRIRQKSHVGTLTVGFQRLLARRLTAVLTGRRPRRLRIVHASVPAGAATKATLEKLSTMVPPAFIAKTQEWLVQAFSEFLKTQSQQFLTASEDPADGVTLIFTIEQPPGLKELGQLLADKGAAGGTVAATVISGTQPVVRVEAVPGHKCV